MALSIPAPPQEMAHASYLQLMVGRQVIDDQPLQNPSSAASEAHPIPDSEPSLSVRKRPLRTFQGELL